MTDDPNQFATEADWLAADDPDAIAGFLDVQAVVSPRKARLVACAAVRAIWDLVVLPESQAAVEAAERFAEDLALVSELREAEATANPYDLNDRYDLTDSQYTAAMAAVAAATQEAKGGFVYTTGEVCHRALEAVMALPPAARGTGFEVATVARRLSDIFRDVVGNPFRPTGIEPRWRTGTVRSLARGIYADRAFDRLPILADALEEAGCEIADILDHCRQPGEHVRGCWVVDLVLGIEDPPHLVTG